MKASINLDPENEEEADEIIIEEAPALLNNTLSSYAIIEREKFYSIQLKGDLNNLDTHDFIKEIVSIILRPKNVFVDCLFLDKINNVWWLVLYTIQQQIEVRGFSLRFLHANEELDEQIQYLIFQQKFQSNDDLVTAISSIESNPAQIHCGFIKALALSTTKTFLIQMKIPFLRRKSHFKVDKKDRFLGDISGTIRVQVEEIAYLCTLTFPKRTFLKVVSQMLGKRVKNISDDNKDAVIEILSMILNQTKILFQIDSKMKLGQPVITVGKSCPSLVPDEIVKDYTFDKSTIFVIPFSGRVGVFYFELAFPEQYSMEKIKDLIKL